MCEGKYTKLAYFLHMKLVAYMLKNNLGLRPVEEKSKRNLHT